MAADIYRIGSTLLNDQESIEKYGAIARGLGAEVTVYPWGHSPRSTDDHLHLDLGYLLLVPSEANDDGRRSIVPEPPPERRRAERREG